MRTLKDHVILYDSECPLCKVYTHAFTATGMLDNEGRAPYQEMPEFACPLVDWQRAVNEIALVDKHTGEVSYGIESLFKVIAHSFPFFRPLFSFPPFIRVMRKVYAFISYNRKVIIPPPKTNDRPTNPQAAGSQTLPLQPAFRLSYRIAYLLFATAVAGYILTGYAPLLTGLFPTGGPAREFLICSGQLLFQGLIVSLYAPAKKWDYLGNMMTISLAGALLLLPIRWLAAITPLSPVLAAGWFLLIAATMLLEHIRRTKLLSLGWVLTVSWICYRLLVLLIC